MLHDGYHETARHRSRHPIAFTKRNIFSRKEKRNYFDCFLCRFLLGRRAPNKIFRELQFYAREALKQLIVSRPAR